MNWLHYDSKVDMWSCGCILAEMLLRRALWPGANSKHQLDLILATVGAPGVEAVQGIGTAQAQKYVADSPAGAGNFNEVFGSYAQTHGAAVELLRGLLAFNPRERLDVDQALAHRFFDDIRDGDGDVPLDAKKFDPELDKRLNHELEDYNHVRDLLYQEMLQFHPGFQGPVTPPSQETGGGLPPIDQGATEDHPIEITQTPTPMCSMQVDDEVFAQ
eukprot:NODE_3899_length_838_cov_53.946554_g3876_i0.p2 GENE.NODE_3899_length_838_cov_53.946554_g3876_i0~~NODE_3899_length_838_cov_53.946554_g3876_i0.p2  ORF type:complete len:248 (-),score=60.07 NODE_3899_length_838_cov_53.946554_g3876_i0:95-742(-)